MDSKSYSAAARTTSTPFIEEVKAIEQAGKPGLVGGFKLYPYAASCILAIHGVLSDGRGAALFNRPMPIIVRECVSQLVDDDTAERFVSLGCVKPA